MASSAVFRMRPASFGRRLTRNPKSLAHERRLLRRKGLEAARIGGAIRNRPVALRGHNFAGANRVFHRMCGALVAGALGFEPVELGERPLEFGDRDVVCGIV